MHADAIIIRKVYSSQSTLGLKMYKIYTRNFHLQKPFNIYSSSVGWDAQNSDILIPSQLSHSIYSLKARSHYTTITITCVRALIGQKFIVIRLKKKSLGWAILKSLSSNDNFIIFVVVLTLTVTNIIFLPIIACLQVFVSLSLCGVTGPLAGLS